MRIKRTLKKVAERLTGTYIFRELPFGYCIENDISRRFPGYRVDVIFDVGANIGQSALSYVSSFPESTIFCFEPIKESFEQLKRNVQGQSKVHCYNLALAQSEGKRVMTSRGISSMNRLLHEDGGFVAIARETEQVSVSTLDKFCQMNSIKHISYLKIDTEGGDLDVLIGSSDVLASHQVDIVEVEAGMNPDNRHHVSFEKLKKYLEVYGYFIFGIYEQVGERLRVEPHLRRINAVFVSQNMIRDYRGKCALFP